jgi:DNA-binding transcriptional MerR regulator
MAHKIAKLLLEHAGTFLERAEAMEVAMSLGMPLHEIEEYLDWLEATRGPLPYPDDEGSANPPEGNASEGD